MAYIVTTKPGCVDCVLAKALLKSNNETFLELVSETPERIESFKDPGYRLLPMVFHDGVLIGGYDVLAEYFET
ncbi:glutaredoxin [Agrobacterium sp. CNPSo 3708]|uniref:glutaredoxin n=1 Tax=unclassified Agrobacterium TaxID=2632611 RepID=UPI0023647454|nr:glutaredoxin [Agrobacterium sp. CNPSo 3708]MDD1499661.1 glutaredoxin [Agrobacterium sp. CNPSo 3708]